MGNDEVVQRVSRIAVPYARPHDLVDAVDPSAGIGGARAGEHELAVEFTKVPLIHQALVGVDNSGFGLEGLDRPVGRGRLLFQLADTVLQPLAGTNCIRAFASSP